MKKITNKLSLNQNLLVLNYLRYLSLLLIICSCSAQSPPVEKINGISFVANRNPVDSSHITPLKAIHANYAAVMPFGFVPALDEPQIIYNTDRQWYGETTEGGRNYITTLHDAGIEVMLKPQLWIRNGVFTGHLEMQSEASWIAFENSYRTFILEYAQLAQDENVAIFCIGTELEQFVVQRPDFWDKLIQEIRNIYKGKLTYAANWDEYKRTPFWKKLDLIGVDAYFPICDLQTPTVACVRNGWEKWKVALSAFAKANDKRIVFTEFGYRSVDYSGKEPWKADRSMTAVNLPAQANALQGLFESVWQEDWVAGGFVWKWFINHDKVGGALNSQFTPQNKPAEVILRRFYRQSEK